jgi:hypothetical protein
MQGNLNLKTFEGRSIIGTTYGGYRYLVAAAYRPHSAVQRLLAYENSDETTYWTREDGEAYAVLMRGVVVHGGKVCETPICS